MDMFRQAARNFLGIHDVRRKDFFCNTAAKKTHEIRVFPIKSHLFKKTDTWTYDSVKSDLGFFLPVIRWAALLDVGNLPLERNNNLKAGRKKRVKLFHFLLPFSEVNIVAVVMEQ